MLAASAAFQRTILLDREYLAGLVKLARSGADFSEKILRLGGDLASFNDLKTSAAVDAIIAALTGENEKLKRFNIIVNEVSTNLRAMAMTGKTTAADLIIILLSFFSALIFNSFSFVQYFSIKYPAENPQLPCKPA